MCVFFLEISKMYFRIMEHILSGAPFEVRLLRPLVGLFQGKEFVVRNCFSESKFFPLEEGFIFLKNKYIFFLFFSVGASSYRKEIYSSWIRFLSTVKILKIGTPEIITIIVLQLEQLDFTVQYCVQKMQRE